MAKSLYSALFDWIVFRINHALLNSKDMEESTKVTSHQLFWLHSCAFKIGNYGINITQAPSSKLLHMKFVFPQLII